MSKINGTEFLLYSNGTLIAAQRDCTIGFNQNLYDTASKDSSGWAEHGNGLRDASIEFEALYSTTGLSADEVVAYITGRTDIMAVVTTDGDPFVMAGSVSNVSVNGPAEEAVSFSGTFTADGEAYHLTGDYAEIIEGWSNDSFDTFTSSGSAITSAISDGTSLQQALATDPVSTSPGSEHKVILFLTLNSGNAPRLYLTNTTLDQDVITNIHDCTEGLNVVTLTATEADSALFWIENENGDAGNWSTSNVYVFDI